MLKSAKLLLYINFNIQCKYKRINHIKKDYRDILQNTTQREILRVVLVIINMKDFTMMNFSKYRVPYFQEDL